jgi:hypothetical protein
LRLRKGLNYDIRTPPMKIEVEVADTIDVVANGARASVPFPSAGYGGHELVVLGSERFLALYLFSGQSEVGWELFELQPQLRHLGGLPYLLGEGHPPVFSADEKWLAMVSTLRDIGPDEDDPDALAIDWAEVRLQPLPGGPVAACTLRLRFDEPPPEREPEYPRLVMVGPPEPLELELPWGGRCYVPFPLQHSFVLPGPR